VNKPDPRSLSTDFLSTEANSCINKTTAWVCHVCHARRDCDREHVTKVKIAKQNFENAFYGNLLTTFS